MIWNLRRYQHAASRLFRLDRFLLGLSIAILGFASFFGLHQIMISAEAERARAVQQLEATLRTFSSFVQADLQAGHYRYVWKQLNRAAMHGAIQCFALLSHMRELLVDDPEIDRRCPQAVLSDPDAAGRKLATDWVVSETIVNPASQTSDVLVLAARTSNETAVGHQQVTGLVTQTIVFLFCIFLLAVSLRWAMRRSVAGLEAILTQVTEGRPPQDFDSKLFVLPILTSVARLGEQLVATRQELVEKSRLAAIALAAQSIAHDVRKPFSLFRVLLESFKNIRDAKEMVPFVQLALPEIQRAMDSVDGLLQDVMSVGTQEAELYLESVSPEFLLDQVLVEVFRSQGGADVRLDIEFESDLVLRVDVARVKRVFSNIVMNACQAMGWTGRIWVNCRKVGARCQFVIGNAGSFIPAENISKLFDAFFSNNKRGGTGLGLAIAKKWVEAHGGSISCQSEMKEDTVKDSLVEFKFSLPLCPGVPPDDLARPALGKHSSQYELSIPLQLHAQNSDSIIQTGLKWEVDSFLTLFVHRSEKFRICIVEDEQIYVEGLTHALRSLDLGESVVLEHIEPNEVLPGRCHLLIVDFDLGDERVNGIDVISAFRRAGGNCFVCLHSNRTDSRLFRDAFEAGADTVFPKPLSGAHFVKLLSTAAQLQWGRQKEVALHRPACAIRVAHVDDSAVMRLSWRKALEDECDLTSFACAHVLVQRQLEPGRLS